jgi:signal transduction histidine kinase
MKSASLVRRVIVAVLIIEFCCAMAMVCSAVWHEWVVHIRALDVSLEGHLDSLVGAVQDEDDPAAHVTVDPLEFRPPPGDVYAVYNLDGKLVSASNDAPSALTVISRDGYRNITVDGHHYRVLQRHAMRIIDRAETNGIGRQRPIVVIYATRMDHVWHAILEGVSFYALMSLALLCVTTGVLVYLLRHFLYPLKELATEASAIKADSLAFHPPPSALRVRELTPLSDALSGTVARLRAAFEKEQRFMSDAAHELKTAVAVVRSTVQLLAMRNRSADEYQRGLNEVLTDNRRVEELVSRMLTLARVSEHCEAALVEVDMESETNSALKNIARFAEQRGVRIASSLSPDVGVKLLGDTAKVLVSNLVMNAVEHSARGSEVRVTVQREPAGGDHVVLEVQDFGSGIAAENLPHVFERFFREDPSRSRETGGVGLGLAICKSIVESAGGTIGLHSVRGEGTTVRVLLKATRSGVPLAASIQSSQSARRGGE